MPKFMVAGNWKMHGSKASVDVLCLGIKEQAKTRTDVEIVVFPPYIFIPQVADILQGSDCHWGGQNIATAASGAYTGEVAAEMLQAFGCTYAIVGHSERRHLYHEDDATVAHKFKRALKAGLTPVLCLGETLEERNAGLTETVVKRQLDAIFALPDGASLLKQAVLAYEPVWAIGTGATATPEQAQAVHAYLRGLVAVQDEAIAADISILYGGSVKAKNARELFAMADINGGLVGGASLDAQEFMEICQCNN